MKIHGRELGLILFLLVVLTLVLTGCQTVPMIGEAKAAAPTDIRVDGKQRVDVLAVVMCGAYAIVVDSRGEGTEVLVDDSLIAAIMMNPDPKARLSVVRLSGPMITCPTSI